MRRLASIVRSIVLAVFTVGTVLPAISAVPWMQQSETNHAQMMAMAGHVATMPQMGDDSGDAAQMMLCKQHCLAGSAILPDNARAAAISAVPERRRHPGGALATSRSTRPPGPPPKVLTV